MNVHALAVLEFEKVRRMLLRWTFSSMGRKRMEALAPDLPEPAIRLSQERIREWLGLELRDEAPGVSPVQDLAPLIVRLTRGTSALEGAELYQFVPLLELLAALKRVLARGRESAAATPRLDELIAPLADWSALATRLVRSLTPNGALLDTASPGLARARREHFEAQQRASEFLSSMLERLGADREETFVTLREGRYVVSVRAQQRAQLPGILHGRSQTGQSVLVEPLEALELNNQVAERADAVRHEELRVLEELSDLLRERALELAASSEAVGILDVTRAAAKLALEQRAEAPDLGESGSLRLVAARHPLLVEAERRGGAAVVPLDLELGADRPLLVVSGPNMGGKTVALKTVGLLTLMARAGLFVPAAPGTRVPMVDDVFVDLGDEQSVEQELSTFAGHLRNIDAAWRGATRRSLVLLDELGGGTDPEEGGALALALLEGLAARGTLTIVTTHLLALKLYAESDPRMQNAAMEFDAASLRPRYRIQVGEAGRSRAFEIARRILSDGSLLDAAERFRSPALSEMDRLHERVDAERLRLGAERMALAAERAELDDRTARRDRERERLRERIEALRVARDEGRRRVIEEAERSVRALREELEAKIRAARPEAALPEVRRAERDLARAGAPRNRRAPGAPAGRRLAPERLLAGAVAWLPDFASSVRVMRVSEDRSRAWVEWQGRRVEVDARRLEEPPRDQPGPKSARKPGFHIEVAETDAPSAELDLRGESAAEAMERLERFLDRAALQRVPRIRIVHGKGTGTLKREVERLLSRHPLVQSHRTGEPSEGGWGVTVADLGTMGA